LRKLHTPHFTVRAPPEHRSVVDEIVSDARCDGGRGPPVDLVESFYALFAGIVMCELLGVPREDRARFEAPAAELTDFPGIERREEAAAMRDMYAYTHEVIRAKRARPGNDL